MRKKFNKREVKELSKNKNVEGCNESRITYTKEFKVEAVKQYKKGLTATQIFRDAGFDLKTIGKYRPRNSLKIWNQIVRKEGLSELRKEKNTQKKQRVKAKNETEIERTERLEAENAYLKEENAFLAKLRAEERKS